MGGSGGSRERITVVAGESHEERPDHAAGCCRMEELQFYPVGHGNYQTPWNRDTLSEQMKGWRQSRQHIAGSW